MYINRYYYCLLGLFINFQKSALDKYNIHKVMFDQIFTGYPPLFEPSKRLLKTSVSPGSSKVSLNKPGSATKLNKSMKKPSPDKKGRQESMDKFVKKTDKNEGVYLSISIISFIVSLVVPVTSFCIILGYILNIVYMITIIVIDFYIPIENYSQIFSKKTNTTKSELLSPADPFHFCNVIW